MGKPAQPRTSQDIPYLITQPDRVPARRYYDPEFYALECERLWPRVWQMACRLEEIPKPGDFVVYDILDQSIIVTRVDEKTVKAYHNACRHRGVQLAQDRGHCPTGFTCPFHGWQWSLDGVCKMVYTPQVFSRENLNKSDLRLRECRLETWGGCAFINLDDNAPPLRDSIEPFATMFDVWHAETLRVEWWLSARLPVNWKLAMEAFMEGYHVMATHPQLVVSGLDGSALSYRETPPSFSPASRYLTLPTKDPEQPVPAHALKETIIRSLKVLGEGMAGMAHAKDIRVAESLRDLELPEDMFEANVAFRRKLHQAVMQSHKNAGVDIPDLDEVEEKRFATGVNFCFPHYFLLPTLGSASSYRIRPLGPEECLFELWSLTRYPEGEQRPPIKTPTPMTFDDPRWPAIPAQDFSNLPKQQRGLHTKGFEFMRLSNKVEGLVSNYQRLIDGYLMELGYDKLTPAAHKVSGAIDMPIADLGFEPPAAASAD